MRSKGETVDRKVYAITEKGRAESLMQIQQNTVEDFISRDAFLMQLFFSGALDSDEQIQFLDTLLRNISALEQRLIDNYNDNIERFIHITGMTEDDSRVRSAVWAHRWGLIKCREYAKMLKEIKSEIQNVCESF